MGPKMTYANVTATLALVLAATAPAWAEPSMHQAASVTAGVKKALKASAAADKRSKKALSTANRALEQSGATGPAGPAGTRGAQGERGPAGAQGERGPAGPSTGQAGGDLAGSYPDPVIGPEKVGPANIGTVPSVAVTEGTNQSGDNRALNFGLELFDVSNMHAATAAPTKLTAPISGIYQVSARIRWASDGNGERFLYLRKNNSVLVGEDVTPGTATVQTLNAISMPLKLTAGDFLEVVAVETSTGSPAVIGTCGEFCMHFSMYWVGPR